MLDTLLDWFRFQSDKPLIFTQLFFWVFFAAVLAGYSIAYRRNGLRNAYLFAVSMFFYYKTAGLFFLLLLFTIVSDYWIGRAIGASDRPRVRKGLLALSIFLNLSILGYFKYAYFFTGFYNGLMGTDHTVFNYLAHWANGFFDGHFRVDRIILPVGISFYTFQTISYIVDIYRRQITPVKSLPDFGFYVSFFPQLVAGPIVRASEFIPQLYRPYRLSRLEYGTALFWILNGLLKKIFLADYLALNFIDRVFANPASFSGFENLAALFAYSLQVYADFSGYTDIAIGVAMLMGFQLPVNFNSPYKAQNVGEFWKRWHISLSAWLKDYLYIPMGGNRRGSLFSYIMVSIVLFFVFALLPDWYWRAGLLGAVALFLLLYRLSPALRQQTDHNLNLMLTMTIGGLWHGASWNMILWGALNGAGLVVFKQWKKIFPSKPGPWRRAAGIAVTLIFITFTRTWFRGESFESAGLMLSQIWRNFNAAIIPDVLRHYDTVFVWLLAGYLIHWLPAAWKDNYRTAFAKAPVPLHAVAVVAVILCLYQVISADLQPFIYFVF